MIIILNEMASPREELLLNLDVIQPNYSFCSIPMLERLLSLNNKHKRLRRSAICKSLPWILTDKNFRPLKHTEHMTFYYRSITWYLSMINSLESRFGFNFVGDKEWINRAFADRGRNSITDSPTSPYLSPY